MSIMRTVVNKPTTVVIISALFFSIALFMIPMLPMELTPDITFPVISVNTVYRGANPEEVESTVTELLESALLNVSGIKSISSTSKESASSVQLEFNWGVDLEAATNDVRDKLDAVRQMLPDNADSPTIFKMDLNAMIPVDYLSVGGGDMSTDELKPVAKNLVQPYLEQIEGVTEAALLSGRNRQVRVEIYQNRLESYGVTMSQIISAIASQNLQVSAGRVERGDQNVALRATGQFDSINDVKSAVVVYKPVAGSGQVVPVKLGDLADVFLGYEDESIYTEIDGKPGFMMSVTKQSGANTVDIAKKVRKTIPSINERLPTGVKVDILKDFSTMTSNSIGQVVQSAVFGAILAVLVILVFLRNVHSAIIIAIIIPLSIAVTLLFMYLGGLSLNMMSLAGLNLGIGMMVDCSIVILENITRYREKGVQAKTAAILGSQEMVVAISASTLTTVCVFLPVLIFNSKLQIAGVLFKDLSFTIVISLLSSLIFSATLAPVLAGTFLKVYTHKQRPLKGLMLWLDTRMERALFWLDNAYSGGIKWALNHGKVVVLSVFGLLVVAVALLKVGVGFELMPRSEEGYVMVEYRLAAGTKLEATKAVGKQLSERIRGMFDEATIPTIIMTVGAAGGNGRNLNTNSGSIMLMEPERIKDRTMTEEQVKARVRGIYDDYPGVSMSFGQQGGGGGGGSSSAVAIKVMSNDQVKLTNTVNSIVNILRNVPIIKEPTSNADDVIPENDVIINREKAYSMGINVATIARELAYNVNGTAASTYRYQGDLIDIYSVLRKQDRQSSSDLNRIFVFNSKGQRVALSNIVSLTPGTSPVTILRENQARTLRVTADAGLDASGRTIVASAADAAAWKAINANLALDSGVQLENKSDLSDFIELAPYLVVVFVVAMLLTYGVMASQFESFKDPFIIMTTLITLPIGPIVLYILMGQSFSVFSVVGIIMLVGIIVNNGIVLVDYTNLMRKRDMPLREAIIKAGRNRLRPILMTSLTTILGMVPMTFFAGEGSELVQPIGATVLGGMISSTIMTLFLVPVLYSAFNKKDEAKRLATLAEHRKELGL